MIAEVGLRGTKGRPCSHTCGRPRRALRCQLLWVWRQGVGHSLPRVANACVPMEILPSSGPVGIVVVLMGIVRRDSCMMRALQRSGSSNAPRRAPRRATWYPQRHAHRDCLAFMVKLMTDLRIAGGLAGRPPCVAAWPTPRDVKPATLSRGDVEETVCKLAFQPSLPKRQHATPSAIAAPSTQRTQERTQISLDLSTNAMTRSDVTMTTCLRKL